MAEVQSESEGECRERELYFMGMKSVAEGCISPQGGIGGLHATLAPRLP